MEWSPKTSLPLPLHQLLPFRYVAELSYQVLEYDTSKTDVHWVSFGYMV